MGLTGTQPPFQVYQSPEWEVWLRYIPIQYRNAVSPSTLPGSSSTERWFLSLTGGTVAGSGTISKKYVNQFYVTFASTGPGTTSPHGSAWYNAGAKISIKATPSRGHRFVDWSANNVSIIIAKTAAASTTATIDGSGTTTAYFH